MSNNYSIGIIGYGYLGSSLHQSLAGTEIEVCSIYNRSQERLNGLDDVPCTTNMGVFMESIAGLNLVVELAHPQVSHDFGKDILAQCDYMPCSVAALADDSVMKELTEAAMASGRRLLVPHGAVVGIDNLFEARDNWEEASITFRKPPDSLGVEGEELNDETILFDGSVKEVALKFPRNVNAMVACALATVGVEKARAKIIADRRTNNMLRGEFEFKGKDGSRLSIVKEEPAVGVSSPGMISSIVGSVIRASQVSSGGIEFV